MIMKPVASSDISAVGYDSASKLMHIRFHSENRLYSYSNVPESIYAGLMAAPYASFKL